MRGETLLDKDGEKRPVLLHSAGGSAADGGGAQGAGPTLRLQARVDRLARLSYEQILEPRVAFGAAAGLIDRLIRLPAFK